MENSKVLVSFFNVEPGGREVVVTDTLISHPAFLIGSDARAQMQLLNIAPSHAIISQRQDGLYIAPCFPNAEVCVNNRPIMLPVRLKSGDKVQIGEYTLAYGEEARSLSTALALPAPVKPAVLPRSMMPRLAAVGVPATARALAPVHQEIYFPRSAQAAQATNPTAMFMGIVTILAIVGLLLYNIGFNGVTTVAASPYAYNDGNVTILMFDADW